MSNLLEPTYQNLPCAACGTEHRDDCPERSSRMTSEPCGCDGGCKRCDHLGVLIGYTTGHLKFQPVQMRPKATA